MKRSASLALALVSCLAALPALAQEHWTEGPVWEVSVYRTKPGKFDDYLKYLRGNYVVTLAEQKKQGLILDTKVFINPAPTGPNDWDICIATLYPSYAKALDYSASDEEKMKAIEAKHFKTADEKKQQEMTAPRFQWRDYISTKYVREVTLKPLAP
ncbi:MAG: hypothetical protein ACM3JH_16445 [Acidithiobacillales bacterium]